MKMCLPEKVKYISLNEVAFSKRAYTAQETHLKAKKEFTVHLQGPCSSLLFTKCDPGLQSTE